MENYYFHDGARQFGPFSLADFQRQPIRSLLLCLSATIASFFASAQVYQSNILFQGPKTLVLSSAGLATPGKGVLSSGENSLYMP